MFQGRGYLVHLTKNFVFATQTHTRVIAQVVQVAIYFCIANKNRRGF